MRKEFLTWRVFARWVCLSAIAVSVSGCGDAKSAADRSGTNQSPESEAKPNDSSRADASPPNPVPKTVVRPAEDKTNSPSATTVVGGFQPDQPMPEAVAKRYRPSDTRPKQNVAALAELGIRRYASKHLELFTDIAPALAKPLPAFVDELYIALERYFGPLPPDREGRVFQMTGYIISDQRLFREAGLLPEDLPHFKHGRHRGAEFWMNDQTFAYYRRHLMLHEATHCYMTIVRDQRSLPPVWYMEGMAELFGTHETAANGKTAFRVMPHDKETFAGLGRITLVQTAINDGRFKSLDQVFHMTADEFSSDEAYAWSWAVCKFLDTHPRYQKAFRELGDSPTRNTFLLEFRDSFESVADDMRTEWALFAHHLDSGYEIEPAAIAFRSGTPLDAGSEKVVSVKANGGWQAAEILVQQGKKYEISATGRFTLAEKPKPWTSEADGIGFQYFNGRPLGRLLGCMQTETESYKADAFDMRQEFSIGSKLSFVATRTGSLYLRLNDSWSGLSDNKGEVRVKIRLD